MLNILSLYGILLSLGWLFQLVTLGHSQSNWLNHPVFVLFILGKQYAAVFVLAFLLAIEILIKRYTNTKFDIKLNNKLPDFVFNFGLVLLFIPPTIFGIILMLKIIF